jgi:hypothetical protein
MEQLLIWLVVVAAVVAILRLLLPFVLGQLGVAGNLIMQVINIVLWAVVLIYVIYFCFALASCFGVSSLPLFPHR